MAFEHAVSNSGPLITLAGIDRFFLILARIRLLRVV
jgi:hypothetical protein